MVAAIRYTVTSGRVLSGYLVDTAVAEGVACVRQMAFLGRWRSCLDPSLLNRLRRVSVAGDGACSGATISGEKLDACGKNPKRELESFAGFEPWDDDIESETRTLGAGRGQVLAFHCLAGSDWRTTGQRSSFPRGLSASLHCLPCEAGW